MSVTYVGGTSIGQAIPGLQQALDGLKGAVDMIGALTLEEAARIGGVKAEYEALKNAYDQVLAGVAAAEGLIAQAEQIKQEAAGVVSDLLDGLGTAGIGMYQINAQAGSLGSEVGAAVSDAGVPANSTVVGVMMIASDGGAVSALRRFFP